MSPRREALLIFLSSISRTWRSEAAILPRDKKDPYAAAKHARADLRPDAGRAVGLARRGGGGEAGRGRAGTPHRAPRARHVPALDPDPLRVRAGPGRRVPAAARGTPAIGRDVTERGAQCGRAARLD